MKSILLTRIQKENIKIIQLLENKDSVVKRLTDKLFIGKFRYVCLPLIKYKSLAIDNSIIFQNSHLLITSKIASKILVKYFDQNNNLHLKNSINLWVVGKSTAESLKNNNFKILNVANNINDLLKKLPTAIYYKTIYLSSNHITKELPKPIKRYIIYKVEYTKKLEPILEIEKGLDYILLYSRNSAITLNKLFLEKNLLIHLKKTTIISLTKEIPLSMKIACKKLIFFQNQNLEFLIN